MMDIWKLEIVQKITTRMRANSEIGSIRTAQGLLT
jgi:hypothetical protein